IQGRNRDASGQSVVRPFFCKPPPASKRRGGDCKTRPEKRTGGRRGIINPPACLFLARLARILPFSKEIRWIAPAFLVPKAPVLGSTAVGGWAEARPAWRQCPFRSWRRCAMPGR